MSYKFEHHDAVIFLERDQVETETFKQIARLIESPAVAHCRMMPDCHAGTGCCVGMSCHLTDRVIPRIIGGDIACGVSVYAIDNSAHRFRGGRYEKRFDRVIQETIPMGNGHDRVHATPIIQEAQYADFFAEAHTLADAFIESYGAKFPLARAELKAMKPNYSIEWMRELCRKVGSDYDYDLRSMGTLGGGNHFIEVGETDEDPDNLYLTVHTGSRNLGMRVCHHHQMKADADHADRVDAKGTLSGPNAYEYFFDMIAVQIYAQMNRTAIISAIVTNLGLEFDSARMITSVHNFIDFSDLVVRKGAIPAREGEKCVVALNMRDGILICKGKGNPEWNCSSAHGCGRIVSRNKAKTKFTMKQYREAMKGVYSTCVTADTIDEAPFAYKDAGLITEALSPTVEILLHVKPTLNVKG